MVVKCNCRAFSILKKITLSSENNLGAFYSNNLITYLPSSQNNVKQYSLTIYNNTNTNMAKNWQTYLFQHSIYA